MLAMYKKKLKDGIQMSERRSQTTFHISEVDLKNTIVEIRRHNVEGREKTEKRGFDEPSTITDLLNTGASVDKLFNEKNGVEPNTILTQFGESPDRTEHSENITAGVPTAGPSHYLESCEPSTSYKNRPEVEKSRSGSRSSEHRQSRRSRSKSVSSQPRRHRRSPSRSPVNISKIPGEFVPDRHRQRSISPRRRRSPRLRHSPESQHGPHAARHNGFLGSFVGPLNPMCMPHTHCMPHCANCGWGPTVPPIMPIVPPMMPPAMPMFGPRPPRRKRKRGAGIIYNHRQVPRIPAANLSAMCDNPPTNTQ